MKTRGREGGKPLTCRALLLSALICAPAFAAPLSMQMGARHARLDFTADRLTGEGVDVQRVGRIWHGRIGGELAQLKKEVRRFLRVPGQTVASPLVSTTLYFVVFGFTLGGRASVEGIPYVVFIVPGLVFLGVANNSFLNSSSSLFITKIQGTVVDLLAAPLGPKELLLGFVSGAMTRGLLVGVLTWLAASL